MTDTYEAKAINEYGAVEPYITHIQRFTAASMGAYPHYHEYIEMLYCIEGVYDIWLNGKYFNFKKDDIVVINSCEVHNIIAKGPGSYLVVRFLPEIIHAASGSVFEIKYVTPFLVNNSRHQRVFTKEELSKTDIPQKMLEIHKEYTEKKYGYEIAIRTHINSIFLWILRYWNSKNIDLELDSSITSELSNKIQQVMDYISIHFAEPFTVMEAAKMCNVSYSYFSRIFKQVTKHSFSEYLNYVRIAEAEKLLATTDLSMTEIAMQTGFSTSSYFIEQFKNHKRISPKQFKKNLLGYK